YAHGQRDAAVSAVRQLMQLDSGDAMLDRWAGESVINWLVESVITWLEVGEARRDEEIIDRCTAALRAMRTSLVRPCPDGQATDRVPERSDSRTLGVPVRGLSLVARRRGRRPCGPARRECRSRPAARRARSRPPRPNPRRAGAGRRRCR